MPDSEKVKRRMEELNMTQAELSREGHIEKSHLNHMLKRKHSDVKESTLAKLCKGLKCKPEDIMNGVD